MSYFLALTGSTTKFSKSGFLLRSIGSILEERSIQFQAIHALDLPPNEPATHRIAREFLGDATEQIEQASAILLVTPVTKESSPTCSQRCLIYFPPCLWKQAGHAFRDWRVARARRNFRARAPATLFRLGTKTSRLASTSERVAG